MATTEESSRGAPPSQLVASNCTIRSTITLVLPLPALARTARLREVSRACRWLALKRWKFSVSRIESPPCAPPDQRGLSPKSVAPHGFVAAGVPASVFHLTVRGALRMRPSDRVRRPREVTIPYFSNEVQRQAACRLRLQGHARGVLSGGRELTGCGNGFLGVGEPLAQMDVGAADNP